MCTARLVTFRGMDYEIGAIIVVDYDKITRMPSFVIIESFVFVENLWIAFVRKLNSIRFCELLQAFVIELTDDFALCNIEKIYDYHPLDSHKIAGQSYVFMAHQIF